MDLIQQLLKFLLKPHKSDSLQKSTEMMAEIHQAITTYERFREHGDAQDLDEAIAAYKSITEQPPFATLPETLQTAVLLTQGIALSSRYEQSQQASDLDRAIELLREAMHRLPTDSPQFAASLTILGDSLLNRYMRTGQLEDLQEAFRRHEMAYCIQELGDHELILYFLALGDKLLQQFQQTGQTEDWQKALNIYEAVLKYIHSPLSGTTEWPEITELMGKIMALTPDGQGQSSEM